MSSIMATNIQFIQLTCLKCKVSYFKWLLQLSSVKGLWPKGLCASPYLGQWISKTWDAKIASMSVCIQPCYIVYFSFLSMVYATFW